MAKPPVPPAMPADDEDDTVAAGGADDTGAADDAGTDDEPGDENVLLTVCKEADGTYSLIKGDEEDADGADAAGSADTGAPGADSGKQTFDSIGPLLKAVLDILKEDESGASTGGDQFQAGFDEGGPDQAAAPMMPQKHG